MYAVMYNTTESKFTAVFLLFKGDKIIAWQSEDMSCMMLFRGEARTQNETLWKVQVGLDQICVHVVELMSIGIVYSAMQGEYGSSRLATT